VNVSAVIVTRGDVDLSEILDSLPRAWEKVVYDNSRRQDLAVYGRYAAIAECEHDRIFVQDDDCIIDAAVAAAYEPGRLVANMPVGRWPDYPDSTLVGWGAIFDRDLPQQAFERLQRPSPTLLPAPLGLLEHFPFFQRACDVVFSALTPRTIVDVGFRHLPWAEDPARAMFLQPGHKAERDRMLELCRQVRTWPDDDRRAA
jgi:hypothetical protein